ncbi:hypothetical protein ES703_77373 [subsurface metagenome]
MEEVNSLVNSSIPSLNLPSHKLIHYLLDKIYLEQLAQLIAWQVEQELPPIVAPSLVRLVIDRGINFSNLELSHTSHLTSISLPMEVNLVNSCLQSLHRNRYKGTFLPPENPP